MYGWSCKCVCVWVNISVNVSVCRCFSFVAVLDLVRVIDAAYKCNLDSDFVFLRYIFGELSTLVFRFFFLFCTICFRYFVCTQKRNINIRITIYSSDAL